VKSVNATNVLKTAAMFGRLQAMETLCEKFKVTVPEDERGFTLHAPATAAFHTAMLHGHYRVAEYLARACNTSADQRPEGYFPSAMNFAVDEGDMRKVGQMLKHRGDGTGALRHAISTATPDMQVIRHLVEVKKVDVNGAEGHWTPFLLAVKYKHNDIAQYLLDKGATPQNDKAAGEALHTAVSHDNVPLVTKMLALGIKADQQTLYKGLLEGSANAVKLLMAQGGLDINAQQQCALFCALRSKKPEEMFNLCVSYGAKPAEALAIANSTPDWGRYDAGAVRIKQFLEDYAGKAAAPAAPKPAGPQP
jgi:ankyrin repeat protein